MHPIVGMVAELNTRFFEWLAFHFGGPGGKRLSLAIRKFGAAVTRWLVSVGSKAATAGNARADAASDRWEPELDGRLHRGGAGR